MTRYVTHRILGLVGVLAFVGTFVFFIIQLIPGDAATATLGPDATREQIDQLRTQMGLNEPIAHQYVSWVGHVLGGDLGTSSYFQQSVTSLIGERLPLSLMLAAFSTILSLLIALPLALLAARRPGQVADRALTPLTVLGVAIPQFWLGLMLILLFSVHLRWFPVGGYAKLADGVPAWAASLVLPVVTLAMFQTSQFSRFLRDGLIAEMRKPYIRAVRSRGATLRQALVGHALRNAVIPTITVVGTSLATVLGGVIIVEQIFSLPGMGQMMLLGIENRDHAVVVGATLIIAVIYVFANFLVDVLQLSLDPRGRAR